MEIETKDNEIVKIKIPTMVKIISIALLLYGSFTILMLFFMGVSGMNTNFFDRISINPFYLIISTIFGLASFFLYFKIRKMKKIGLYGTLVLIFLSYLPVLSIAKIGGSGMYVILYFFEPISLIKIAIFIYLIVIRKKFI